MSHSLSSKVSEVFEVFEVSSGRALKGRVCERVNERCMPSEKVS